MKLLPLTFMCSTLLVACRDNAQAKNDDTCDSTADADGDGLDDCSELSMGLDPESDDSDGDGIADGIEVDCGADPNDSAEYCYECGWGKNDPENLVPTGSEVGDVMANIALMDQCGEMVNVYDLAGEYHIVYQTAAT